MHLSCSMQCWASACSAVPSSRKGGGTTQTMCPLHSKTVLLQLGEFRRWIHLQLSISISKYTCIFSSICKTNKTLHKNMRQLPEIKHAVWFESCWLLLTTNICKTTSKYQKHSAWTRPDPKSTKHSFATQMNSKNIILVENVYKQLFMHQNQL